MMQRIRKVACGKMSIDKGIYYFSKEAAMRDKLQGKMLRYHLTPIHHRGRCGYYNGRIVKVHRLKSSALRSITVRGPSYDDKGFGWKGACVRLVASDWQGNGCGVWYYKNIVPVETF